MRGSLEPMDDGRVVSQKPRKEAARAHQGQSGYGYGYGYESFPGLPGAQQQQQSGRPSPRALKPRLSYKVKATNRETCRVLRTGIVLLLLLLLLGSHTYIHKLVSYSTVGVSVFRWVGGACREAGACGQGCRAGGAANVVCVCVCLGRGGCYVGFWDRFRCLSVCYESVWARVCCEAAPVDRSAVCGRV